LIICLKFLWLACRLVVRTIVIFVFKHEIEKKAYNINWKAILLKKWNHPCRRDDSFFWWRAIIFLSKSWAYKLGDSSLSRKNTLSLLRACFLIKLVFLGLFDTIYFLVFLSTPWIVGPTKMLQEVIILIEWWTMC